MPRSQLTWTKEEDEMLLNSINIDGRKNWKYAATQLKNKTPIQCFYRFRKINPEIKKSKWTNEEDQLLISLHENYGNNWSKISKILMNRGPKQIRDRFINNLDPKIIRGNFTITEDLKILEMKNNYGNKWSQISKHFENRSPDIIKSRYYSSVKNKVELLYFLKSLDNTKQNKTSIDMDRNCNDVIKECVDNYSFPLGLLRDEGNLFGDNTNNSSDSNISKSPFFESLEEKFDFNRISSPNGKSEFNNYSNMYINENIANDNENENLVNNFLN